MVSFSVLSLCLVGTTLVLGFPNQVQIGFINNNGKIVGGEDAAKGEFPWQVSLQLKSGSSSSHRCGGSIIDATHVLCAGHCVVGVEPSNLLIVAGAHNITDHQEASQQTLQVSSFVVHEDYNGLFIANDIAVIALENAIVFDDFSKPALLCQEEPRDRTRVVNSGWGNAHPEGDTPVVLPDLLQKVYLQAIDRPTCRRDYPLNIRDHMVCAIGARAGDLPSGACNGDSGGPLMYEGNHGFCVVGIVSFGKQPCGNAPSVYTSVPFYLDWIAANGGQA